jgi:hypothetical protein
LHLRVNWYACHFDVHAWYLQAKILCVWLPPNSDQHLVRIDADLACGCNDRSPQAACHGIQARHPAGEVKRHSPLTHRPGEGLAQISIHQRQKAVQHLDDGYFHTKGIEKIGELDSNGTAADDEQTPGQSFQC